MNIIFLDYDGVVNTLWFQDVNGEPNFNFPRFEQVNNTQAIAWLNKLYREIPYSIVVTSTWRMQDNYKECLYKAGINKNIKILGKTKNLGTKRGIEIQDWLDNNKELQIENFVILDDDMDMEHLIDKLVLTDTMIGINYYIYYESLQKLKGDNNNEFITRKYK